ncbi:MAG: acyl-CoA ligase (AMP-forming), exosortase A system-associated [Gammaproteobacteria bacterium]|nr:acyl-CoA ligase (AMP-forming), exosortase A system-associated [Gammaproteobacteria bacterium]
MNDLFHQLVTRPAHQRPNATALVHRTLSMTYAQLARDIQSVADGLRALGLRPGERVAIYLPKQSEAVVALFATAAAGGIFVPVNPQLKPEQVQHILNDASVSVLVTSSDRAHLLGEVINRSDTLRHVVLVDDTPLPAAVTHACHWSSLLSAGPQPPLTIKPDNSVAILYTSGSTGKPKGVELSHRNLVVGAHSVAEYLQLTAQDRVLALLPLSFDYGLSQLSTAFLVGGCAVLFDYLLPRDVLRELETRNITVFAAVPTLWVQLASLPWPDTVRERLRLITSSGGVMPPATLNGLRTALPDTQICLMYGLTEAFRSTFLPPEELANRPSSMGRAIPNAEVMVLRPDGSPCTANEPGELVHAGPLVARGYWKNPEHSAHRFRKLPSGQHAVWSGDTVRRDEAGFFYFVGREDDMIKTSGYRVSPTEIEAVITETGCAVEVAVFGVPDPVLGQAIAVALGMGQQADCQDGQQTQWVLDICRQRLPTYMVPRHVTVTSQLPKTPNSKIDRPRLVQEFMAHASSATP